MADAIKFKIEVNAKSGLHVRKGPGTSFAVIYTYENGHKLNVYESKNGWYRTGVNQWVSAQYTRRVDDAPAKKTQPAQPPKPNGSIPTQEDYKKAYTLINEGDDLNVNFYKQMYEKDLGHPVPMTDVLELADLQNSADYPELIGNSGGVQFFNYGMSYDSIQSNIDIVKKNLNILGEGTYKSTLLELYEKYNRFKVTFPEIFAGATFPHVFFTRPDLNLFKETKAGPTLTEELINDAEFFYLFHNDPLLLKSLTRYGSPDHDFNMFLSNSVESFEIADEFIRTAEHGDTFTGYKIQYGKHNVEANTSGTFSLNYTEDKEYSVYKIHKSWLEYISRVYRGELTPKHDYIQKKILDYACSVYYFVLGPDGETILFWSKFFGVFPTNTPASASSFTKGSSGKIPEFGITYAYSFKEDLSPLSLAEFNMNSRNELIYKKTYEPKLGTTGRTLTGAPFVETSKNEYGHYVYKLRFRKVPDNLVVGGH